MVSSFILWFGALFVFSFHFAAIRFHVVGFCFVVVVVI